MGVCFAFFQDQLNWLLRWHKSGPGLESFYDLLRPFLFCGSPQWASKGDQVSSDQPCSSSKPRAIHSQLATVARNHKILQSPIESLWTLEPKVWCSDQNLLQRVLQPICSIKRIRSSWCCREWRYICPCPGGEVENWGLVRSSERPGLCWSSLGKRYCFFKKQELSNPSRLVCVCVWGGLM